MACFDTQILKEDFPYDERVAASVWKLFKEGVYTGAPFENVVRDLGTRMGVKPEIILQALDYRKTIRPAENAALWRKQRLARASLQKARSLVQAAGQSGWAKTAERIWGIQRAIELTGHYAAFTGTHGKESLMVPSEMAAWAKATKDSWALGTKKGRANYEKMLVGHLASDEFIDAAHHGLDNDPEKTYHGQFTEPGKVARKLNEWTGGGFETYRGLPEKAFNLLKMDLRQKIWNNFSEGRNLNPEAKKLLASIINHTTGSVKLSPGWSRALGLFLFSPKLLPAQLMTAYVDPFRALYKLGKGKTTPDERLVAKQVWKRLGWVTGIQAAALAANYASAKAFGDEENVPNLSDMGRADWLRLRIGGRSWITSPTVEWMKFPFRLMYKGATSREPIKDVAWEATKQLLIYRQNPVLANIEEALFGQEPSTGRPTPMGGLLRSPLPTKGAPQITPAEYVTSKGPIPMSTGIKSGLNEFEKAAEAEGVPIATARGIGEALVSSAASFLGYSEHEVIPPREEKPPTERELKERGYIPKLISKMKGESEGGGAGVPVKKRHGGKQPVAIP